MTKEELAKKKGIKPAKQSLTPAENLLTAKAETAEPPTVVAKTESKAPKKPATPKKSTAETSKAAAAKVPAEQTAPAEKKTEQIDPPLIDKHGNGDRGLGLNQDGTFRQSTAGRKKTENKKCQMTVTLSPDIADALKVWASAKRKTATVYLSEYIDEHLEEIMNYFDRK